MEIATISSHLWSWLSLGPAAAHGWLWNTSKCGNPPTYQTSSAFCHSVLDVNDPFMMVMYNYKELPDSSTLSCKTFILKRVKEFLDPKTQKCASLDGTKILIEYQPQMSAMMAQDLHTAEKWHIPHLIDITAQAQYWFFSTGFSAGLGWGAKRFVYRW